MTRGSTTRLRPVSVAMVRATDSISALAKLSVIGSPARSVGLPVWLQATGRALTARLSAMAWARMPRVAVLNGFFMTSSQADMGARAIAPPQYVQEVGQRALAARGGFGLTAKTQSAASPASFAAELELAAQGV